ncbi:MAG TPA: Sapep family Mn(2+)-dependent dipeptidase [Spirochaetales bacterium]|nr:Sapep family Mn(2+)-dependent dipeptidase [Spirochaetales bacterium]HRY55758.1 Sapep family Mn(2+)-dependent dipeptidase [Spirochaetia bacterium]HRZ64392.1 Sapep family Mn(2+)-dependent dipeptidase [Spirochaetia bacterium]
MDELAAYFERNAGAILADILGLVSIHSESEDRAGARRALEAALALAGRLGLSARLAAGGEVGIAEIGPDPAASSAAAGAAAAAPETLGILAHVDVVPEGDPASWTRSPRGELAEGAVWGRGTVDDKGPLVLCLWAVKALLELGRPIRKRIQFIVGSREEIEWADIEAFKASGERLPDYGFTPDGEFPLINREKGYCDVRLSFDRGRSGRVGAWELACFEGGVAVNSVPAEARALLRGPGAAAAVRAALAALPPAEAYRLAASEAGPDSVEILAHGTAAHSSIPEKGDNALLRLASFLAALGPNPLASFLAEGFSGGPRADSLGLQTRPEYALGEYIGPTTASPDLLRSAEAGFELEINLRPGYGQTAGEIEAAFGAAAARYGFAYRVGPLQPALFIPKDRPFMAALMAAYEARSGRKGEFVLAPGTSYAKAMPKVAAFGPILPGSPDLCHEADERLGVADALLCAAIYADAIGAIAGSAESMA